MPREPEAFCEQVVHILRRHFPDREVHHAGPMDLYLDGRHLGLNNLYRMVLSNPDRGVEIVEDFLDQYHTFVLYSKPQTVLNISKRVRKMKIHTF